MLRRLLLGVSRLIFDAALLALVVALLLGYVALRIVRWAVSDRAPRPVSDAGYRLLVAGVELARALGARTPAPPG